MPISFDSKATVTSATGWGSFLDNGANYIGANVNRSFNVGKTQAASVWLIGAGRNTGSNDGFKLSSVNVTGAVPATWAMMLLGFGGIGFAMRRRKGKITTNVNYV